AAVHQRLTHLLASLCIPQPRCGVMAHGHGQPPIGAKCSVPNRLGVVCELEQLIRGTPIPNAPHPVRSCREDPLAVGAELGCIDRLWMVEACQLRSGGTLPNANRMIRTGRDQELTGKIE